MIKPHTWKDRIKEEFERRPLESIAIGALATTALAKLVDSVSAASGRRAYAKQVNYRVKHKK